MNISKAKDYIGITFLALSFITLLYMAFACPLNQIIVHVDEYFTQAVVSLPMSDIITVTAADVHPPLHYLLGKIAIKAGEVFGLNSLYCLKLLSIIPYAFILLISATKIRKDYGLFTAGVFSLSLLLMSDFFKYYFVARMYTWAMLFIILAFICTKEIIDGSDKRYWIFLSILSALCAYTHYFAAITATVIYLILLAHLITCKKDQIKYWVISAVVGIILYLPWMPALISQLTTVHESYWIQKPGLELAIW